MTDRPRGPWDETGALTGQTEGRRPFRYWVLPGLTVAMVVVIMLLVVLDRHGAFRPEPEGAAKPMADEAPPASAFDPRYELPRPASPASDVTDWFSSEDYPAAAMREGLEGRTRIAFRIGIDGRVSGCRTIESSGSPILDATTCGLIRQRGRFWPARDADGEPVPTEQTRAVRWQLPED